MKLHKDYSELEREKYVQGGFLLFLVVKLSDTNNSISVIWRHYRFLSKRNSLRRCKTEMCPESEFCLSRKLNGIIHDLGSSHLSNLSFKV